MWVYNNKHAALTVTNIPLLSHSVEGNAKSSQSNLNDTWQKSVQMLVFYLCWIKAPKHACRVVCSCCAMFSQCKWMHIHENIICLDSLRMLQLAMYHLYCWFWATYTQLMISQYWSPFNHTRLIYKFDPEKFNVTISASENNVCQERPKLKCGSVFVAMKVTFTLKYCCSNRR